MILILFRQGAQDTVILVHFGETGYEVLLYAQMRAMVTISAKVIICFKGGDSEILDARLSPWCRAQPDWSGQESNGESERNYLSHVKTIVAFCTSWHGLSVSGIMRVMDAHDLHSNVSQSLMDKIAADPEIINRAAVGPEAPVVEAPPVVVTQPVDPATAPKQHPVELAPAPVLNLLAPNSLSVAKAETVVATAEAVPKTTFKKKLGLAVLGLVLLMGGGGAAAAFYMASKNNAVPVAVRPTASPVSTLAPSPSTSPAPTPTPTPSPAPTPAQTTVSAPVVQPTVEHPQFVTVKSKSGLWLRSSPDSSTQKNVIGWMPYNGQVSVDTVGNFWWHGTYAGKPGYFAVSYTN